MQLQLTTPDQERFEQYVDRSGGPDACHEWTGACNTKGYGWFRTTDRAHLAHRVSWLIHGGKITDEEPCVLHSCDNPTCVNPRHLWAGSVADNNRDMAAKGRGVRSRKGLPFGVHRHGRRFESNVRINGKLRYLGTYDTPEEANAVSLKAKYDALKDHNPG